MIPPFQGVDIRNFYFGTDDVGRDVLSRLIWVLVLVWGWDY